MKVVHLTIKNRALGILLALGILALGVTFLTVGVALLAGLALTGALVGTGMAIYRRLRGTADVQSFQRLSRDANLDPSLEVQPTRPAEIAPPRMPDK